MIRQTGIEDVERELFHGTNKNVVDANCRNNFDFPEIKLPSHVIQPDIIILCQNSTKALVHDSPAKLKQAHNVKQTSSFFFLVNRHKDKMIRQTGIEDVERELFHGTNKNVVDAICRDNFDWRVAGKNGTVLGQGEKLKTLCNCPLKLTTRVSCPNFNLSFLL